MEFLDREPIYLQISRFLYRQILTKAWGEGNKIPSVREMAVDLEVNPNTVSRTYLLLQEKGIIENRRGVGYFIGSQSYPRAREEVFRSLQQEELPRLFQDLSLLDLTPAALAEEYQQWIDNQTRNNHEH